ncbi:hypothetical protein TNIN_189221 [Trichonephila inaurata madagascariensis]|uniref:Uncharacterized protein n=1 Tax=Trichonephila inaurata madagascariensis TaxID=2747483 RepID=A0A8X6WNQ7_9ARAC|nr:hypothetical protein TNIN_189221 [Trichonephila inaurata madagascariensis]
MREKNSLTIADIIEWIDREMGKKEKPPSLFCRGELWNIPEGGDAAIQADDRGRYAGGLDRRVWRVYQFKKSVQQTIFVRCDTPSPRVKQGIRRKGFATS